MELRDEGITAESGATATEYIILLVFIALAIIAGVTLFGGSLNAVFTDTCERVEAEIATSLPDTNVDCEP
jgi:Flp pilus assembly pilin Flp